MRLEIKRDTQRNDVWWDYQADNRYSCLEVFKISAHGQPVKDEAAVLAVLKFNEEFGARNLSAPAEIQIQFGRSEIRHLRVPVGYAQAFQDAFNTEFSTPEF